MGARDSLIHSYILTTKVYEFSSAAGITGILVALAVSRVSQCGLELDSSGYYSAVERELW